MTRVDTYKHLDADSKLAAELSMPEVAAKVCALNHGAHRLLSAMVHELRARNEKWIAENPKTLLPESPLADGIEALLNQGHYF